MTQRHASKRSQRNSHNPYRDYDDKIPTTNPFLDEKEHRTIEGQTQLSPMFVDYLRAKTGAPVDVAKINTASDTADKYRGIKIAHTISPVDGKTKGCDREHTFETFVDNRRISGDAGREKKIGHGWQVARALKRVLSSKGRGSRKARQNDDSLPDRVAA